MKNINLTKGSVYRGLIRFCLPLFFANILTLLYNLADTIIVGRLLGNEALAGVGSTGTIMFIMNGLAIGFTTGSSVVTSRFFGGNDKEGVRRSAATSVVLALSVSVLLTVILVPTMPLILKLVNTDKAFYDEAYNYITVIAAGFIVMNAYKLAESLLRAIGIARMSLIFAIISFLSNILLDIVFIVVFRMGTEGAALATILSFAVCAALCIIYIVKKAPVLHFKKEHFKLRRDIVVSQLRMALPMSLQHSIKGIGSTLVQSAYNTLGTIPVAAYAVAGKIEHITTDAYSALGSGMATFTGQNSGAGEKARIKKGMRAALVIGFVYTALSGALLLLFGKSLTPLFVKDDVSEVSRYVGTFLYCVAPFFALLCTLVTLRYSFQGLGYSAIALTAAICELLARSVMSFVGSANKSFVITTLSYPVSWGITAAFLIIIYFVKIRRKLK